MSIRMGVFLVLLLGLSGAGARADTLAKSLNIVVYPANNQTEEQQSKDDYECFGWAKGQTGYDPMDPPEIAAQAPDQGPSGARVRGAARGAAGGAIIGEIADDDAGKGAAIGATVGTMRAGRQDRQQRQQQAQQAEQVAADQQTAMANQFRGAYATCMQGRGYSVNY